MIPKKVPSTKGSFEVRTSSVYRDTRVASWETQIVLVTRNIPDVRVETRYPPTLFAKLEIDRTFVQDDGKLSTTS